MGKPACHSVSARLAYMTSDRSDTAFACKECSRAVGKPRADLTRLKRIGRYLLLHATCRVEVPAQQQEENIVLIDGLSDG